MPTYSVIPTPASAERRKARPATSGAKKMPFREDGVRGQHDGQRDDRHADPWVAVRERWRDPQHATDRAHDEGEQRDLQLPHPSAIGPDVADRERDPQDRGAEDRNAEPDPRPAYDLAGDAGEGEVRRGDPWLELGCHDGEQGNRDRDGPEADEGDRQPPRRLALDGQRGRDRQDRRRQERRAGGLEPPRDLVDARIGREPTNDDRQGPDHEERGEDAEGPRTGATWRSQADGEPEPRGQDHRRTVGDHLELLGHAHSDDPSGAW